MKAGPVRHNGPCQRRRLMTYGSCSLEGLVPGLLAECAAAAHGCPGTGRTASPGPRFLWPPSPYVPPTSPILDEAVRASRAARWDGCRTCRAGYILVRWWSSGEHGDPVPEAGGLFSAPPTPGRTLRARHDLRPRRYRPGRGEGPARGVCPGPVASWRRLRDRADGLRRDGRQPSGLEHFDPASGAIGRRPLPTANDRGSLRCDAGDAARWRLPYLVLPLVAAIVAVPARAAQIRPTIKIRFRNSAGQAARPTPLPGGASGGHRDRLSRNRETSSETLRRPPLTGAGRLDLLIVPPRSVRTGAAEHGAQRLFLPVCRARRPSRVHPSSAPAHAGQPGLKLTLSTTQLGSIRPGSPVHYRGIEVGSVTGADLSPDATAAHVQVFVAQRYERLVRIGSRFWTVSGVDVNFGLFRGLEINIESLRTLVAGGISFATPDDPGAPRQRRTCSSPESQTSGSGGEVPLRPAVDVRRRPDPASPHLAPRAGRSGGRPWGPRGQIYVIPALEIAVSSRLNQVNRHSRFGDTAATVNRWKNLGSAGHRNYPSTSPARPSLPGQIYSPPRSPASTLATMVSAGAASGNRGRNLPPARTPHQHAIAGLMGEAVPDGELLWPLWAQAGSAQLGAAILLAHRSTGSPRRPVRAVSPPQPGTFILFRLGATDHEVSNDP